MQMDVEPLNQRVLKCHCRQILCENFFMLLSLDLLRIKRLKIYLSDPLTKFSEHPEHYLRRDFLHSDETKRLSIVPALRPLLLTEVLAEN